MQCICCMYRLHSTVYNVHKAHLFWTQLYIYQSITDNLYVQCIEYRLSIGNTYIAYCV